MMDPQTILIEAWLQASESLARPPGCLSESFLDELARGQLTEQEARSAMLHLTHCSECRNAFAHLAIQSAASARPIPLRELLSRGDVDDAWRLWLRSLVYRLPLEMEMSTGAGEETALAHIDERGRLIIENEYALPPQDGTRIRLTLSDAGRELELCDAVVRHGRLYAVVDLSALSPRAGVLREGVLSLETVTANVGLSAPLAQLERWRLERLQGTDYWDRFTALTDAYGGQLVNVLLADIEPDAERTTRGTRARAASETTETRRESAWETTLAYTRATLQDYAQTWQECNGVALPGVQEALEQLEQVVQRVSHSGSSGTGSSTVRSRSRSAAPIERASELSESPVLPDRLSDPDAEFSEQTLFRPARAQTEVEQTLLSKPKPHTKPEGGG